MILPRCRMAAVMLQGTGPDVGKSVLVDAALDELARELERVVDLGRSAAAWLALPRDGLVVVVTHGGPIAAVRAMRAGAQPRDMARYRVAEGSIVPLTGMQRATLPRAM
jgi:broad specificity phosphatase PhoE